MKNQPSRVLLPIVNHPANRNMLAGHPAEKGYWVWHPDYDATTTAVLRFRLSFQLKKSISLLIHVTGDQRFQLRCDGEDVTFGPDRCDLQNWTVQTLRFELAAGRHEFESIAWWISEPKAIALRGDPKLAGTAVLEPVPPMAQMTRRGGFLLYSEELPAEVLNTGVAPWTVEDLTSAVKLQRIPFPFYHDIGPSYHFDLDQWGRKGKSATPTVVLAPLVPNQHGLQIPGWGLVAATLPEQLREPWTGGRIRAFRPSWKESPILASETSGAEVSTWQQLIEQERPVTIPPRSEITLLWDFETYVCGYPQVQFAGGAGAELELEFAEALYEANSPQEITTTTMKGHRGQIEGKVFLGFGDRWQIGKGTPSVTPSLWWRCGRYVRIRIKTGRTPLILSRLGILTTGYPLDTGGAWKSSDTQWDRTIPLFLHAFRSGGHETWTDTPYYEQMCYVGDNITIAASNYAWFTDDRLCRRSIELFNCSRRATGLVAERYPSGWRQECGTFSLLWPTMVRDYGMWRDDAAFVRSMLPGVRSMLAEFEALVHEDGLLHHVPGWPFIDWVPEWDSNNAAWLGYEDGVRAGDSSLINLFWVRSLQAGAQIEEAYGEPQLASYYQDKARKTFNLVIERYWDKKRNLLRNTRVDDSVSEHAQILALITGYLDAKKTKGCLATIKKGGIAKATIYFSFYLLDALYRHGESAEFFQRLAFWRTLPELGFTSTPESGEPSRSDAHAWGAHPAWHTLASIAGVRPASAGFQTVRIAPMPGEMQHFDARVVHPKGTVDVRLRRSKDGQASFTVRLPKGVSGQFVFQGVTQALKSGKTRIRIAAKS